MTGAGAALGRVGGRWRFVAVPAFGSRCVELDLQSERAPAPRLGAADPVSDAADVSEPHVSASRLPLCLLMERDPLRPRSTQPAG